MESAFQHLQGQTQSQASSFGSALELLFLSTCSIGIQGTQAGLCRTTAFSPYNSLVRYLVSNCQISVCPKQLCKLHGWAEIWTQESWPNSSAATPASLLPAERAVAGRGMELVTFQVSNPCASFRSVTTTSEKCRSWLHVCLCFSIVDQFQLDLFDLLRSILLLTPPLATM